MKLFKRRNDDEFMANRERTNNILFLTEADWIENRQRVISHVLTLEEFQIFYLNTSLHKLGNQSFSHTVMSKKAWGVIMLLQSGMFDAIVGDAVDLMILKQFCRMNNLADFPAVMMTLDPQLKAFGEIAAMIGKGMGGNPAREVATAPDVFWFSVCREYAADLKRFGIVKERVSYLPSCTFAQWLMNPRTEEYLNRRAGAVKHPAVEQAKGKVVAAGVFNRDFRTFIQACDKSGVEGLIITDMKAVREYIGRRNAGGLDDTLRKSKKVKVIERVPLDVYIACLRESAAVAVPLLNDRQITGHLTIADAQRLAKPVVSTNFAAARDFIAHDRTGLLYEPGNADSLSQHILTLTGSPNLARKLGAAARRAEMKLSKDAKAAFLATVRKAVKSGE